VETKVALVQIKLSPDEIQISYDYLKKAASDIFKEADNLISFESILIPHPFSRFSTMKNREYIMCT
jgi:hypothetical protein